MQELERVAERVRKRYRPAGNVHVPMWESKSIGGSSLVSKTAREIAEKIIEQREDDVDKKWAFLGNTIGDAALEDVKHKEVRFEKDIGGGWTISGHCDGIEATNAGVIVYEHKYFLKNETEKQEKATRQAMLYLALGAHKVAHEGTTTFPIASYAEGPDFTWDRNWGPLGVVTCIAPSHLGEGCVVTREVSREECEEVLAFYEEKAGFIVAAVDSGDLTWAEKWDQGPLGIQEFSDRPIVEMKERIEDEKLDELIREYKHYQDEKNLADRRIRNIKPLIDAEMKSRNLNRATVGEWSINSVTVAGGEVSYYRKPYTRIDIKGGS